MIWLGAGAYVVVALVVARYVTTVRRQFQYEEFQETALEGTDLYEEDPPFPVFGLAFGFFWIITVPVVGITYALDGLVNGGTPRFERERALKQREADVAAREREIAEWTPPPEVTL